MALQIQAGAVPALPFMWERRASKPCRLSLSCLCLAELSRGQKDNHGSDYYLVSVLRLGGSYI